MNASVKSSSTAGDFEASCPHKCSNCTTEVETGTWKWMKHKEVVHSNNHCWNRTIYDRVPIEHLFTIHVTLEMRHVDKQLPFWQPYCSKLKNIQNLPATPSFLSWYNTPLLPYPLIIALCFLHPSLWVQCPYQNHRYITFIVKKPRPQEKILLRRDVSPTISDTVSQSKISNPYTDRVGHERGAQTMVANFDWIGLLSPEESLRRIILREEYN